MTADLRPCVVEMARVSMSVLRTSFRGFSSLVRNYPSGVAKELPCTPAPLTPKLIEKTSEFSALRTKELGSWKELTAEEKVTRELGVFVS